MKRKSLTEQRAWSKLTARAIPSPPCSDERPVGRKKVTYLARAFLESELHSVSSIGAAFCLFSLYITRLILVSQSSEKPSTNHILEDVA